jgi:hypothetical protein
MFSDRLVDLFEAARSPPVRGSPPGRCVVSLRRHRLFDFIHNNQLVEFHGATAPTTPR